MVKRYGDEAQPEAATLADQLLEKDGDPVASAILAADHPGCYRKGAVGAFVR